MKMVDAIYPPVVRSVGSQEIRFRRAREWNPCGESTVPEEH